MLTMDPKSWRLYALPLSVCSVVLDFPPLLLGCATTALILKLLWRSCLSLFFRTHKPWGRCKHPRPSPHHPRPYARLARGDGSVHGLTVAQAPPPPRFMCRFPN